MATSKKTIKEKAESQSNIKVTPVRIPSPVKSYSMNPGSRPRGAIWEAPEWNLGECSVIMDVESMVRRAFKTKKNLFLKEGYEFNGPNPERVKYIEKRIGQIEAATGIPFPSLVNQLVGSLIRCNNAYWVKVRNFDRSSGKLRIYGNKLLEPVAGYFPVPPESIYFKRNDRGRVLKYKQCIRGQQDKEFNVEDVIHFYIDKREGFAVATPTLVSVKDDIRALRRIEENVELLVHQHLFPLFHYKVGTPDLPAGVLPDGSDELQAVRAAMQEMPTDGCWVTSERHEIKVLGAEGSALAVDKFIAHYKQRIYTGLGVSPVDMGESSSASRSTADTLSRNLVDDTKADQRELGSQIYTHIITELLLESTFDEDTLFDEENRVYFKFNEIDIEHRIKKENHACDMYLKNAITHPELRNAMGRKPLIGEGWPTSKNKATMFTKGDGEWAQTNYGLIERDKIILQSIDEPGTDESKNVSKSTASKNNSSSASAGGNSVSNKNKPTNQYGTRGSAKFNRDSVINQLDLIHDNISPIEDAFCDIKKTLNINESKLSNAKDSLILFAKKAFRSGLNKSKSDILSVDIVSIDKEIENFITDRINKLNNDLKDTIEKYSTKFVVNCLINRASMIDFTEVLRAYNYGFILGTLSKDSIKEYSFSTKCDNCGKQILNFNQSSDIIYKELPPLHYKCTCMVS